jgi:hypothetical protein
LGALSNIKNALWFCYNLLQSNEHHEEKELKQQGAFWILNFSFSNFHFRKQKISSCILNHFFIFWILFPNQKIHKKKTYCLWVLHSSHKWQKWGLWKTCLALNKPKHKMIVIFWWQLFKTKVCLVQNSQKSFKWIGER